MRLLTTVCVAFYAQPHDGVCGGVCCGCAGTDTRARDPSVVVPGWMCASAAVLCWHRRVKYVPGTARNVSHLYAFVA